MKKIYIPILFICALAVSCTDFDPSEVGIQLQDLPGYVAFNAPGSDAFLDDEDVAEDGGTVTLNVECPTGNLDDITVTFDFSGDAIFGVDFDVAGATAAGGILVIPNDVGDVAFFNNEDLDVEILTDGVVDGPKVLNVNLVSAVGVDGTDFAVGRGGTDLLRTATINISDID